MLKLYYKDFIGSFNGELTIAVYNSDGSLNEEKTIRQIQCRSGANSYSNRRDVRGKSPVPVGKHMIWTEPQYIMQMGQLQPTGGQIGEFYPISNTPNNRRLIKPVGKYKVPRYDIGLHPENSFNGSAGCIVVINHKTFKRISRLLKQYPGKWEFHVWRAFK